MDLTRELDKYKDKIVNIVIIVIAIFVASNILKGSSSQIAALKTKISDEEKKSEELNKVSLLEKRLNDYKRLLVEQEASQVMSSISDIAKASRVKLVSVRPTREEKAADYLKRIFDVNIIVPDYEALVQFVNAVESFNNVYIIENMFISVGQTVAKKDISVSLSISSISLAAPAQK